MSNATNLPLPEKSCSLRRPRTERRLEILTLRRKKKKIERQLQRVFLDVEFENQTTTGFGNFHFLESFKKSINLNEMIYSTFTLQKPANSIYSAEATLDFLIDSCLLGCSRFDHTEALRYDPGYRELKGIDRFPSEKVFRDLFSLFDIKHIQELCKINQRLIALRSLWEGPKAVDFDIDSSIVTIFGNQEGGEVRYNPRYHGRPSFELFACFIKETKELLYVEICPTGKTPKGLFRDFLSKCEALLPKNYILKGVRIDKGFFGEENLEYLESRHLSYAAKVPLYTNIRRYIENIPSNQWEEVNEFASYARKKILLDNWKHDRYIDIRRIKIEKRTGQMVFPEAQCYRYEAIVCTELEQTPAENLNWYDGRATCENYIKEVKDGFGMDEASQHLIIKNTAYIFVKAISYNLFLFFREVAMPAAQQSWQVNTVRRKLINLPGNILGHHRNHRIKLADRPYLKLLFPAVRKRLQEFLWFVANGFRHIDYSLVTP